MSHEGWLSVVVNVVIVSIEIPQQYASVLGIIFLELDTAVGSLLPRFGVKLGYLPQGLLGLPNLPRTSHHKRCQSIQIPSEG